MHTLIISAVLATAGLHSTAAVSPEVETYAVAIPIADLNLATHAGVKKLHGRAMLAARRTCGDTSFYEDRIPQQMCREEFMRQVEVQLASLNSKGDTAYANR